MLDTRKYNGTILDNSIFYENPVTFVSGFFFCKEASQHLPVSKLMFNGSVQTLINKNSYEICKQ